MTDFYKQVESGYIVGIGTNGSDAVEEITAEEYEEILTALRDKPTAPSGYAYRLTEALEWELVELPPEPEPELTAEEALEILLGGETA